MIPPLLVEVLFQLSYFLAFKWSARELNGCFGSVFFTYRVCFFKVRILEIFTKTRICLLLSLHSHDCSLFLHATIIFHNTQLKVLHFYVHLFHHSPNVGWNPFDFSTFPNGERSIFLSYFHRFRTLRMRRICFVTCLYSTDVRSKPSIFPQA